MHTSIKTFDKYIKSNILHKHSYKDQSRLQQIVMEHTVYYRKTQVIDSDRSAEMKNEILNFIDVENTITDTINYYNYIIELAQLSKKMSDREYAKHVELLRLCAEAYMLMTQIRVRNNVITQKLSLIEVNNTSYNSEKLIKDYDKAEDKQAFIKNIRYTNTTPYSFSELHRIKNRTGMTTKTNMFFDEVFIIDDIMTVVDELKYDLIAFIAVYQEFQIKRYEYSNRDYNQIFDETEKALDIDSMVKGVLTNIHILENLIGSGNFNPEYPILLAYIRRLLGDICFIRDSSKVYGNGDKATKQITDMNNTFNRNISILNEFKNNRDDNSLKAWLETDPFNMRGFNGDNIQNLPGSYKYLSDFYGNTTSEFDPNFRDKILGGIAAGAALFGTGLKLLEGVVDMILGILQGLFDIVSSVLQNLLNLLMNALTALKCLIKAAICAVMSIVNTIADVLGRVIPFLKNLASAKNLTSDMRTLPGSIMSIISSLSGGAADEIIQVVQSSINNSIKEVEGALGGDMASIFSKASAQAKAICSGNLSSQLTDTMIEWAKGKYREVIDESISLLNNSSSECPSMFASLNGFGFSLGSLRLKRIQFPSLNDRIGGC